MKTPHIPNEPFAPPPTLGKPMAYRIWSQKAIRVYDSNRRRSQSCRPMVLDFLVAQIRPPRKLFERRPKFAQFEIFTPGSREAELPQGVMWQAYEISGAGIKREVYYDDVIHEFFRNRFCVYKTILKHQARGPVIIEHTEKILNRDQTILSTSRPGVDLCDEEYYLGMGWGLRIIAPFDAAINLRLFLK